MTDGSSTWIASVEEKAKALRGFSRLPIECAGHCDCYRVGSACCVCGDTRAGCPHAIGIDATCLRCTREGRELR
jgi:hypothetical protein